MATVSATRAAATFPVFTPSSGHLGFAFGTYEVATALAKNDIVQFCRVPACTVTDGFLRGDDIDTGIEAFEFDVGYAANGSDAADPDGFLNSGVLTGDAIAGISPEAGIDARFTLAQPVVLAAETVVQGTCIAIDNTGGTGSLYCGVYYVCGL